MVENILEETGLSLTCRGENLSAEQYVKLAEILEKNGIREQVYIATKHGACFTAAAGFFARLASASEVIVAEAFDAEVVSGDNAVQIITDSAAIFLPMADIIDFEKEKARLAAEQKKLEDEISRIEKKLSNQGFVSKAPAAVVEGEKAKMEKYRENLAGVTAALAKLG